MKTFRTVGSGSTQTIEPIENNKIPVYETKEAAEADIANLSDGQIIATKDEGNEYAKPVDAVESGNLHAVTSNAVADSLSYSTQEVKTGGTWIDGKPIYRKTFVYEGETTANASISIGSISNVEDIETIKGSLRLHAGGFISLGYMNNDNNKVFEVNTKETGEIMVISPYNSSNSKIIITVEYTKTTD